MDHISIVTKDFATNFRRYRSPRRQHFGRRRGSSSCRRISHGSTGDQGRHEPIECPESRWIRFVNDLS
jgi:hypothetical protein